MKWIPCLAIILFILAGCSKTKAVQFCEGISPEGKGVNCGTKFEDGDLTAVISGEEPFNEKAISVQVYEVKPNKTEKIETLSIDVKPEDESAFVNLSFYTGGKYIVRARTKNAAIGSGEVEIVER